MRYFCRLVWVIVDREASPYVPFEPVTTNSSFASYFARVLRPTTCHARVKKKVCDEDVLKDAPESIPWLARLARTRSTVVIPMTNPIGYYNTVRSGKFRRFFFNMSLYGALA